MIPTTTFEKTLDRQKIFATPTGFQNLSQIEHVEKLSVELVDEAFTN